MRKSYELQGIIRKPDAQYNGAEYRPNVGICEQMCPIFEQFERQANDELDHYEVIPGTKNVDPNRAIKKFRRSDAGSEEPLPEDVRTPEALVKTMSYMVSKIIANDPEMKICQPFVRDRTRAIRIDFTYQNIHDERAIAVFERIARFHILSHHICGDNENVSQQQEIEQLTKSTVSKP